MGLRTALGLKSKAASRPLLQPVRVRETDAECPLCGSNTFEDYRSRELEKCHQCGSLGRDRLMTSTLRRLGALEGAGRAALHIAPELALATELFKAFGEGYLATDIGTARLDRHAPEGAPRALLDICNLDDEFAARRFDLIVHSHVLEHIYGNWALAVLQLQALLKPGGFQVFSFPMRGTYSAENLDPNLPERTRVKEFGQRDHTRSFGSVTFAQDIRNIARLSKAQFRDARSLFTAEELEHMRASGHIFVLEAVA